MKKAFKIIGIIVAVFVMLAALWITDNFVYPFKSVSPNYSDVERAFAKLQFPSDWEQISSSENRGIHGRDCDPLNGSGCFHKSRTFKVPEGVTSEDIKRVILDSGLCAGVVEVDITQKDETKPSKNLACGAGGSISLGADFIGPKSEAYVSVKTY